MAAVTATRAAGTRMSESPLTAGLDPVLHQPTRTRIVAYLAGHGSGSFSDIKTALALTDGNLETHLKKLGAQRYIMAARVRDGRRTQTIYALTEKGEQALDEYVGALRRLLALSGSASSDRLTQPDIPLN
jgi:predicted ArsR family transcriptional regulator